MLDISWFRTYVESYVGRVNGGIEGFISTQYFKYKHGFANIIKNPLSAEFGVYVWDDRKKFFNATENLKSFSVVALIEHLIPSLLLMKRSLGLSLQGI